MHALQLAQTDDLNALQALEHAAQEYPWSQKLMAQTLASDRVYILKHQTTIIAYAAFNQILDETTLLNTTVAPDYRRQGLAEQLLSQALDELYGLGARVCFLEVRESNQAAICLYQKMAFQQQGKRKNYYPCRSQINSQQREDAVLMMKELTSC